MATDAGWLVVSCSDPKESTRCPLVLPLSVSGHGPLAETRAAWKTASGTWKGELQKNTWVPQFLKIPVVKACKSGAGSVVSAASRVLLLPHTVPCWNLQYFGGAFQFHIGYRRYVHIYIHISVDDFSCIHICR